MRKSEMWLLLSEASLVDHRTVTEEIVAEWLLIVPEDVTVAEARAALIEHRRSSTEYLLPAHIVQGVREARWARRSLPVESERAAVTEFVKFTGLARDVVIAHWSDASWREARLAEARVAHHQRAIERGAA